MRICSLLPSGTEILYSLGLGNQIVAVSEDCDLPPAVRLKPIISKSVLSGKNFSSRQIHELVESHQHKGLSLYDIDEGYLRKVKPDLILTQELCEVCAVPYSQVLKAAKVLDQGPKVVSLEPRTLEDVLDNILLVGKLTGTQTRAEHFVSELRKRIDFVKSNAQRVRKRPKVLNLEWIDPPMAGGHWVPQMVQIAGGRDDMVKVGEWTVNLTWSRVVDYGPEVIVVMPCSYTLQESLSEGRTLDKIPGWKTIPAVREGKVYAVNAGWYFSRSGPGLVTGLEIMAEILHPELFEGLAPSGSCKRISY
jgi:iron complex transport system substrate-binding protein